MQEVIPTWFLILALFLPRLSLFCGWMSLWPFPVPQPWSALLWVIFPRVLVILYIASNQGMSIWFWIHLVVALLVYLGGGSYTSGNTRQVDYYNRPRLA